MKFHSISQEQIGNQKQNLTRKLEKRAWQVRIQLKTMQNSLINNLSPRYMKFQSISQEQMGNQETKSDSKVGRKRAWHVHEITIPSKFENKLEFQWKSSWTSPDAVTPFLWLKVAKWLGLWNEVLCSSTLQMLLKIVRSGQSEMSKKVCCLPSREKKSVSSVSTLTFPILRTICVVELCTIPHLKFPICSYLEPEKKGIAVWWSIDDERTWKKGRNSMSFFVDLTQ